MKSDKSPQRHALSGQTASALAGAQVVAILTRTLSLPPVMSRLGLPPLLAVRPLRAQPAKQYLKSPRQGAAPEEKTARQGPGLKPFLTVIVCHANAVRLS